MYKVLYGVPVYYAEPVLNKEYSDNEEYYMDWFDFEVGINDNGNYYIDFETMLGFEGEDGCKNYIRTLFENFTEYMKAHEYDISKELDMYEVFTEGINVNTEFHSIEDLYAWFKFAVYGFNGKGLYMEAPDGDK